MKAAAATRYGRPRPTSCGFVEVDAPTVGNDDVLIKVHATTVNRTDCAYRAAFPFFMRAFTGLRRPNGRSWARRWPA
jgi:NADPH:quinone reductase-like Zn-dependent oxidoreductase